MAKVKTYWDEIKDIEMFYYGGSQGWEVHLRYSDTYRYNPKTHESKKTQTLQFQWPFYTGDGVSREEKSQTRKDVTKSRKLERILASASIDRSEYLDLCKRTYSKTNQEAVIDLYSKGIKGFALRNHIIQHFLTDGEAYSLFYRM